MMKKVERNAQICAMRASGATLKAVGLRYGISKARVQRILKREEQHQIDMLCLNLAAAERGTLVSDMQAMWQSGVSIRNMVERLGATSRFVTEFIRQNRDLFPLRGGPEDAIETLEGAHPLVREVVLNAREKGINITQLCDRAGISRATVLGWRRGSDPRLPMLAFVAEAAGLKLALVPIEREAA